MREFSRKGKIRSSVRRMPDFDVFKGKTRNSRAYRFRKSLFCAENSRRSLKFTRAAAFDIRKFAVGINAVFYLLKGVFYSFGLFDIRTCFIHIIRPFRACGIFAYPQEFPLSAL